MNCPKCGGYRYNRTADGRYQCYYCQASFDAPNEIHVRTKKKSLDDIVLSEMPLNMTLDKQTLRERIYWSRDTIQQRDLFDNYQTLETALKHLIKAGKVQATVHYRGWFAWKTYTRIAP